MYASVHIDIGWNGTVVSLPHSHVVWFLKHGRWPKDGFQLDHIDDDPMNNAPANLQEMNAAENQEKRRGRIVYRSYGSGKYGYGINIALDKRDGRYYVTRQLSRGHGEGDLKNVKKSLGGFDTLKEAEAKVEAYIADIEKHGLDHMPAYDGKREKGRSIERMHKTKVIRGLRAAGHTYQQIADMTGFSIATVYHKAKDVEPD
jgi:hypothetical protein